MKKVLFSMLALMALSATAQNLRLNLYSQYAFEDAVDSYYSNTSFYDGKIEGGLLWGAGLEYLLKPEYGLELSYQRMDTKAPVDYYSTNPPAGVKNAIFDLAGNYIMIGGMRYLKKNPNVEPYFGMQMGMIIANVTRPANQFVGEAEGNATKFAWGLRGGVNIFPQGAASKVGIKLQAGLLSAVQSAGGGLYFGTGGAGAGVSSYSSILQFTLGGGLVFNFGGEPAK